MTDIAAASNVHPQPVSELLEKVRAAASWDVIHRPVTASSFPARVLAAQRSLKLLERDLALVRTQPGRNEESSAALLELRSNRRQLRSAVRAVADRPTIVSRLPRVVLPAQKDEPRAASIAALYLRAVSGDLSATGFRDFIRALQENEPLTLDELWNLPAFLKFILLESLMDVARILLRSPDPVPASPVSVQLKSLRIIGHTNWSSLIEPLIVFDATLRMDPAGAYGAMDFDSREFYRKRVATVARHSDCSELQVAQASLELAREADVNPTGDARIQGRHIHVGYYLFDKGFPHLASRTAYHPPLVDRARAMIRAQAEDFYITGIQLITIFFVAALILLPLPHATLFDCLIAALVLLLPAMQCAVDLVNDSVTSLFDPEPLPKLDFSKGIPSDLHDAGCGSHAFAQRGAGTRPGCGS